jgi:hypothetical protein
VLSRWDAVFCYVAIKVSPIGFIVSA